MLHRIFTYKELHKWSEAYVKGAFGLFFLIGSPGHAKSWTIRKLMAEEQERAKKRRIAALSKKAGRKKPGPKAVVEKLPDGHIAEPLWIEGGAVSAFKLYQQLYLHLHEMVVMDDVDSIYSDRNLVRLLKALCQTEKTKTIGWWTDNRQLEALDIPTKFQTRSRVCIIANQWRELSQHVESLMSRGVMIDFQPSIEEVFAYVKREKITKDKAILDFVGQNLWMVQKIDIRHFLNAEEAKRAKLDWQDALGQSLGIRDMLLVDRLRKNKSYHTIEERASDFMRLTGQSRPMYFKAATMLDEAIAARDKSKGKKSRQLVHMA